MNISYNWLKDLIDINIPPDELGRKLTGVGLAVEGIHLHGDDNILDIDLTSNRPDCLSHLGVAREIAAITGKTVRTANSPNAEIPMPAVLAGEIVTIDDKDLCHRFTARVIRNVKIGPSPQWLVDRLEAIGERSINNVADITNYVMHELGQPMHSFDLDMLAGKRVIVRRAHNGEMLTTLDDIERKLDDTMLVICDAEKPVSVAGIMGGSDSGITDSTVNVLLEVAYFDRPNIRATSRKLNLATEASYRFERGVDIENVVRASSRAAELICELAGGDADEIVDVYATPHKPKQVGSSQIDAAVRRLTGLSVDRVECVRILDALGVRLLVSDVEDTPSSQFVVPSWRHDISIEEDLVEEIARHVGYENIGAELPPAFGAGEYKPNESRVKRSRQTLVDLGFDEVISYSFIDTDNDDLFETVPGLIVSPDDDSFVTLRDAVIEGAVRMRPSVIPGLLAAVRLDFNQQRRDVKLFEIGKAFANGSSLDETPNEQELLGLLLTGSEQFADRAAPGRAPDFYDVKGAVEAAIEATGILDVRFEPSDVRHLRRGQSASIAVNGTVVGYVGRLSDDLTAKYKFRQPVFACEINLQTVLSNAADAVIYKPLPRFPEIVRDVSFVVERRTSFESISDAIIRQNIEFCRKIEFVDVYEISDSAAGQRSLTIRIHYRSNDATLQEAEIDALHTGIVENVKESLSIDTR